VTATAAAVARVASRHEVLHGAVMPVVVKVIDAQCVGILGIDPLPADRLRAPVTRVDTGADGVVERNAVDVSAPVGEGQRVAGELAHPVPLGVKRLRDLIRRSAAHHAPVVQVAESLRLVGLRALFDRAADCVPEMMNVSMMVKTPSMHLAQVVGPFIRFRATFNRALLRPGWTLKCPERITVLKEASAMFDAITVRIVWFIATVNAALFPHSSIISQLRARDPSFYGATYCVGCRLHRPVGKHGEFTWLDEAGNDTHVLVGT